MKYIINIHQNFILKMFLIGCHHLISTGQTFVGNIVRYFQNVNIQYLYYTVQIRFNIMLDLIIIALILFIYRGRDEFIHKARQTILRLNGSINLFDTTLTVNLDKTLLQQI